MKKTSLPPELNRAWDEIEGYAKAYGLDFYPIIYEVLDYRTLYETAALGGFPTRYPHWRFGMEYDQLLKGHVWLGSTIYEMVINTNPSYAYLLEGNEMVTQKMVMAHVSAHVDFFKNNMWFAHTNRKMLDEMANHAARVQRMVDRYGYTVVEDFIDICLSIDNLIDYHAPYIRRPDSQSFTPIVDDDERLVAEGLHVERDYMKGYINPPEFMAQQLKKLEDEQARQRKFPENPQKDILLFLMNYAPLERWQHSVLEIIRDEAYYFAPQGMTKTLNEGWACLSANSLLYSEKGLITIEEIVKEKLQIQTSDGVELQPIYDWAVFQNYPTIKLQTRCGLELEGSVNHRVMRADASWCRLDQLHIGDMVKISAGHGLWAEEYVKLDWQPQNQLLPAAFATAHIPSSAPMHMPGLTKQQTYAHSRSDGANLATLALEAAPITLLSAWRPDNTRAFEAAALRKMSAHAGIECSIPSVVDEQLAALLGYLCGGGQRSTGKHTLGFATGDEMQAQVFANLVRSLFGIELQQRWDVHRWRLSFSSAYVQDFLSSLGIATGVAADNKAIPDVILRSPERVVASFLRALYDCAGYADSQGIILATSSARLGKQLQLLLLNYGMLSRRYLHEHGGWHVHISGYAAIDFSRHIGFGLEPKQAALCEYIEKQHCSKQEEWSDEVISISHGQADVYDISVAQTHRYAAQGFINHNSFWHSEIMTRKALKDSELIDFADHHSGVVAVQPGRLNPYKLGLELLRDIEDRWNRGAFGKDYDECDDLAEKLNWDRKLGLGRQKIFEVRRFYNDVTFIDEFLTPEFALRQKLFTFRYNRDADLYEIASREYKQIKEKLLFRMTNFGQPFIYVEDGNYNNRGELYLRHRHEGIDLKMDYARDTLRNIQRIWQRPVHIETVVDERKRLVSFDGKEYGEKKVDNS